VIREEIRKEELDGGRAFDDSYLFIGCKISIGKNKNDIQGKFRGDFSIVVVYL
jgi:hypothetical protein